MGDATLSLRVIDIGVDKRQHSRQCHLHPPMSLASPMTSPVANIRFLKTTMPVFFGTNRDLYGRVGLLKGQLAHRSSHF